MIHAVRIGVLTAVVLGCASCAVAPLAASKVSTVPDEFLANYRAAERAVLGDLSLTCRATFPAGGIAHRDRKGSADYLLSVSSHGDRTCWSMRLDGLPRGVEYLDPDQFGGAGLSSPEYYDGEMAFWLTADQAFLPGDSGGDFLDSSVTCLVAPDGSIRRVAVSWGDHRLGGNASAHERDGRAQAALYAGGRGYSACLTSISEVADLGRATYRVRGLGTLLPFSAAVGGFELIVDVANGYLVRECKFTVGSGKDPDLIIHSTSEGVIGSAPQTIARRGKFSPLPRNYIASVEFDSIGPYSESDAQAIAAEAERLRTMPNRMVTQDGRYMQYTRGVLTYEGAAMR